MILRAATLALDEADEANEYCVECLQNGVPVVRSPWAHLTRGSDGRTTTHIAVPGATSCSGNVALSVRSRTQAGNDFMLGSTDKLNLDTSNNYQDLQLWANDHLLPRRSIGALVVKFRASQVACARAVVSAAAPARPSAPSDAPVSTTVEAHRAVAQPIKAPVVACARAVVSAAAPARPSAPSDAPVSTTVEAHRAVAQPSNRMRVGSSELHLLVEHAEAEAARGEAECADLEAQLHELLQASQSAQVELAGARDALLGGKKADLRAANAHQLRLTKAHVQLRAHCAFLSHSFDLHIPATATHPVSMCTFDSPARRT